MGKLKDAVNKPGILPRQFLVEAVEEGYVSAAEPLVEAGFQPATIDLRISNVAYRLRSVFSPHLYRSIREAIDSVAEHTINVHKEEGAILENNHYYLIPLEERLQLPPFLRGKVSPKSSIGRLDVFVRILAEGTIRFDDIPAGYRGNLFALVAPRSFAVVVRPGDSLAQLRLFTTVPGAIVRDEELNEFWSVHPLLYRLHSSPTDPKPIGVQNVVLEEGLFLSADFLRPPKAALGYRPRREGTVIDLRKRQHYKVETYWEHVLPDDELNVIRLIPDNFYLVRCQELVSIPPRFAAEMLPYDYQLGELRSHYAGFFDPGFGFDPSGRVLGTPAVLEIRSREPFIIRHGHTLCRLQFYRMLEEPELLYGDSKLDSSYQSQRYPFSKHFTWPQIVNDNGDAQLHLIPKHTFHTF